MKDAVQQEQMIHSESEDEEVNPEPEEEQKEEQPSVEIEKTGAESQPTAEQVDRHGTRQRSKPDFFGNNILVTQVTLNKTDNRN